MNLIALKNIRKSFPDGTNRLNHVLRGVDLDVSGGEFITVRGASGSGKTTLLLLLGTLIKPDSGSFFLDKTDMTSGETDFASIRNQRIGFVFQDHRLLPQYTALENILLPVLAGHRNAGRDYADYARYLLSMTGLDDAAERYPHSLSGGEAGRIAVCRALIMKPQLLLADEPTGQLDAENAQNMSLLLAEMNQKLGTTIVMVTHSNETASVAQRTVTLKDGLLQ